MKFYFNYIAVSFFLLVLSGCSWVKEDMIDCPHGLWLNIRYSYNILDVDAASTQVDNVTFYIFDGNNRYVGKRDFDKTKLKENNYTVEIEGLAAGDYNFVALAGLADNHFESVDLIPEESELQDLMFRLRNDGTTPFGEQIEPLFYGTLSDIKYDGDYDVEQMSLMKDTNQMACVIRSADGNDIDFNDYEIRIEADNGCYDEKNTPIEGNQMVYIPYESGNVTVDDLLTEDQQNAGRYALNVMRLMKKDNTRLKIVCKETSKEIIDLPLTNYLLQVAPLYNGLGYTLEGQEYLDRQDFYTLIFYFSSLKENVCLLSMSVNGWIIRLDEHIEL